MKTASNDARSEQKHQIRHENHPKGFTVVACLSPGSDIATTPDKHLAVTSSIEWLNLKIDESLLLLPFEMDLSMPLSPQY